MSLKVGFVSLHSSLLPPLLGEIWLLLEKGLPSLTTFKGDVIYLKSQDEISDEERKRIEALDLMVTCPTTFKNPQIFTCLGNLKWLQLYSAGVDRVVNHYRDKPKPNFILTRNVGFYDDQICQLLLSWICLRERRMHDYVKQQALKIWSWVPERSLDEVVVGIVGYGSIGKKLAKMCTDWGMSVVALVRENQREGDEKTTCNGNSGKVEKGNIETTSDLPTLLSSSHYIISILPQTPETTGFFDASILKHCRNQSPVFVNVGRGNVVSEESILEALDNKWISHALLDVFPVEPLPSESPLWLRDDVTILPHVAARAFSTKKFLKEVQEKYKLFVEGLEIPGTVDWNKMY